MFHIVAERNQNQTESRMQYENILFKVDNNIAQLVLNRPERLNALNEAVVKEMSGCHFRGREGVLCRRRY